MMCCSRTFRSIGLIPVLCLSLQAVTVADILFEDDFEDHDVGAEPEGWEYDPSSEVTNVGQVTEDPFDPDNLVFTDYGGYRADDGAEYVDFVAEWDWMFYLDDSRNNSVGFHVQGPSAHYQLSRRGGGLEWHIYMFNGSWNLIGSVEFPTEIDKWYRVQLSVMEGEFIVKAKEKDDETPFEDLDPILEIFDDTFDTGAFSTSYWGPIDNVIIAETEDDLLGGGEEPQAPRFIRGDVDGVGGVNITDGVSLLNHLFSGTPPPPCLDAADANDDGAINIATAVFIFNFLFSGGASPPAPGAECGPDPTDDPMGCDSYDGC